MKDDKLRMPVSDKELIRRRSLVQDLMKEKNLDFVIAQGTNMHLGGYVRWFTDIPAEYNLPMTVLLPQTGRMTLVRSSLSPIPVWAQREIEAVIYGDFCPSVSYSTAMEAALVIDWLRKSAPRSIGFISKAYLSFGFFQALMQAFPEVRFVDITNEIDAFKAIKSDEEMALVRLTCKVHDQGWAALPAIIKPGMTEYQIRAECQKLLMDLGSEEHLMFIGTAPPRKPCNMYTVNFANRRLSDGDYGLMLMEVSGPGGYYCESARNFCFGEPFAELQAAWDTAVEAQQLTADLAKPGTDAKVIVREYNKFIESRGYAKEYRLYGHSQGYDLVERPAFMNDHPDGQEAMTIKAGMNVSLHPYFGDDLQTTYINDNYYISESGAERIHKTPSTIITL